MTPSDIEILIHYHVSPEPHPRLSASAVTESVNRFLEQGLIKLSSRTITIGEPALYTTTSKGAAHISQLCKLPLPIAVWANDEGEII